MTKQETAQIIYIIKATYPKHFQNFSEVDFKNLVLAWHMVLADYSVEEAQAGLKVFLSADTKGFPPSPGQIVDGISRIRANPIEEISELEAWSLVRKAISNSGYHSVEEFEKLPELCQKAVGSPANLKEWALMESKQVETVEQSHFISNYRTFQLRKKQDEKLPLDVRNLIEASVNARLEERTKEIESKEVEEERHLGEEKTSSSSEDYPIEEKLQELREKLKIK